MTSIPRIALKVRPKQFSRLILLSSSLIDGLTGNVHFPGADDVIDQLTEGVATVKKAYALHGTTGNYGSKKAFLNLCQEASKLHSTLNCGMLLVTRLARMEAGSDHLLMATILSSSKLPLMKERTPVGVLAQPRNFRCFIARNIATNKVKLKWERPINTLKPGYVRSYMVLRSNTPDFATAEIIAQISRTSYIDTNITGQIITYFYWVIPVNAYGKGVPTEAVTATLTA